LIVTGAVTIVNDALKNLEKEGVQFDKQEKAELVKKMMVITCSD